MADRNRDQQQNRGPQGYRHRYDGGYEPDPNRSYRRTDYGPYEEEGYIQDIGREHTDLQGNWGRLFTGRQGIDYAQGLRENETLAPAGRYGSRATGRGSEGGPHRGKGPRNYQRSQERIREDVCERLTDDGIIDATNVEVRVENDEVVLNGVVHNREEKRRAEDLAEAVAGVRNVENRLRVEQSTESEPDYYREYDEEGRLRHPNRGATR
jgi:hypothetical protein